MPKRMIQSVKHYLKRFRRWSFRRLVSAYAVPGSVSKAPALVLAPHPDDEVFGCGGLIALKRDLGLPVTVVFLTHGEASHRACCQTDPKRIGAWRRQQALASLAVLGVAEDSIHWLACQDGQIPQAGDPTFLETESQLAKLLQHHPGEIYTPHPLDGWPDHKAATELTRAALQKVDGVFDLYYYPVWMWYLFPFSQFSLIPQQKVFAVDVASGLDRKREAMDGYLSSLVQPCGVPGCGRLPEGFLDPFQQSREFFFRPS
ncbi:MAG: PIG-L family deacetylase [Magnetococcales bacterium]|nr:PIG-L family deacetylase [Magnetococcales bacterium]